MENDRDLHNFADQLQHDLYNVTQEQQIQAQQAFLSYFTDVLIEVGELEDGSFNDYKHRGMEVSGYDIDSDNTLNLFINIPTGTVPPTSITKTEIESAFKRLNTFIKKVISAPYYIELEETTLAFDMAEHIYESRSNIHRVRLYVFTDGLTKVDKILDTKLNNLSVSYHVWDIRRLYQTISSGEQKEPIHIDFVELFGSALPCLQGPNDTADYSSYLTILPGEVLKSIYAQYGSRLLQLNVRSYLQARGKVNKEIRRTILEKPERFLAYNNGISTTASNIEMIELPKGGIGIKSLDDLQIVNGGQTTASIFHTALKEKADLSHVHVQAKISVIVPEQIDELVKSISRYANSQNKVNEADFSANDPFHVKLENLSRIIWAPATDGTQKQTRWFYERARGQYQDMLYLNNTPASQRQFKATHPTTQKFTRTDFAKFEVTWEVLPHIVSMGAQKCFLHFNTLLQKKGQEEIDHTYFHHLVAKAILFRQAEAIISRQKFGAYRANIVTYTLAFIYHHTAGQVDLDLIWQRQRLGEGLCEAIMNVSQRVHTVIIGPPGNKNVTEWCKRPGCWHAVRDLPIELPLSIQKDLITNQQANNTYNNEENESTVYNEQQLIEQLSKIPADVWLNLAGWARETRNLDSSQRRLASSIGLSLKRRALPSPVNTRAGLSLLEEAQRLGFKM